MADWMTQTCFHEHRGSTVAYRDLANDRQPVLYIHGGGPGVTGVNTFGDSARRFASRCRPIVVDTPGYGESTLGEVDGSYFAHTATALVGLLDVLGLAQVAVVAHSLGAGTAVRLALDYPDRVQRLVLVAPGGGVSVPVVQSVPTLGSQLLRRFIAEPAESTLSAFMTAQLHDVSRLDGDEVARRYSFVMENGNIDDLRRIMGHLEPTLWTQLGDVHAPCLLVWGRDDQVVSWDQLFYALSRLPAAEAHVFSRCGHIPQLEHSDALDAVLAGFLVGS